MFRRFIAEHLIVSGYYFETICDILLLLENMSVKLINPLFDLLLALLVLLNSWELIYEAAEAIQVTLRQLSVYLRLLVIECQPQKCILILQVLHPHLQSVYPIGLLEYVGFRAQKYPLRLPNLSFYHLGHIFKARLQIILRSDGALLTLDRFNLHQQFRVIFIYLRLHVGEGCLRDRIQYLLQFLQLALVDSDRVSGDDRCFLEQLNRAELSL